jgi:adenine C2-methylase RlmN of 23S rRNA A2503 and tRNA A37
MTELEFLSRSRNTANNFSAATLRREMGHDIAAACGQLRLQSKRVERPL